MILDHSRPVLSFRHDVHAPAPPLYALPVRAPMYAMVIDNLYW